MMDLLFVGIGWTDLAITMNRIELRSKVGDGVNR